MNATIIKSCINHDNMIVLEDISDLSNKLSRVSFYNTNMLFMSSANFSGLDIESIINLTVH